MMDTQQDLHLDRQIESTPTFPLGTTLFGLLGVALVAGFFASGEAGLAIGSIPCWVLALVLFVTRQSGFSAVVTKAGLEIREAGQMISFESIQNVVFNGKVDKDGQYPTQQAAIHVSHETGTLLIPANIDIPSNELFSLLCHRFQPIDVRNLNPLLEDYQSEQVSTFGDEKVYRFTARQKVSPLSTGGRMAKAIGAGMMLSSVGWFVAASMHDEGWIAGGIILLIVGLVVFLVGFSKGHSPVAQIKDWENSGLVISPVGLALIQGPLKGRMRWEELKDVKFNQGRRSFQASSGPLQSGILLHVEGSFLVIADLYNQPIATVHERIMTYWRGQ